MQTHGIEYSNDPSGRFDMMSGSLMQSLATDLRSARDPAKSSRVRAMLVKLTMARQKRGLSVPENVQTLLRAGWSTDRIRRLEAAEREVGVTRRK
jgi:hypothetical protein